jgi:hypothetical protein
MRVTMAAIIDQAGRKSTLTRRTEQIEGTGRGIVSWVDILETWRPTVGLTCAIAAHASRDSV